MDEAVNMVDFKAGVEELKKKHFAFIRQELGISKGGCFCLMTTK